MPSSSLGYEYPQGGAEITAMSEGTKAELNSST